jgi:MFS family permease
MINNPALLNFDYRRLLAGTTLHQQGVSGEQVVLGVLTYELTGDTAWVGIILAIYFLPFFIFGLLSGAIADWTDRRVLLARIELCTAAVLFIFAITTVGNLSFWSIATFTLVIGSLRALHQPLRSAYAYDLVGRENLVTAMGLLNLASRSGQLIGALIAGFVIERYGICVALSCLATGHLIAFIPFKRLQSAGIASAKTQVLIDKNIKEYISELCSNRLLLGLLGVTAGVEIFGFSFATALPEIANDKLNIGAEGLGWLQSARALAGILAGITFATFGLRNNKGSVYIGLIFLFGLAVILLSQQSSLSFTLGAVFLISLCASSCDILSQSLMQLSVKNELRGRAIGIWVFALGFGPLGHLELGMISSNYSIEQGLLLNGIVLISIAILVGIITPRISNL